MVATESRPVAFMILRKSLPNNLAKKIVNTSYKNHRHNEKLKNTRRQTHVGHLPNNLTKYINELAGLRMGLTSELRLARAYRAVKGSKLALDERNRQRQKRSNSILQAIRKGNSYNELMRKPEKEPVYIPFY